MRNGWRCSTIDRRWLAGAAVAALAALAAMFAALEWRGAGGPAALYRARCSACHPLPDMSRFDAQDYGRIVTTMREKHAADKVISDDEAQTIVRYLEETAER